LRARFPGRADSEPSPYRMPRRDGAAEAGAWRENRTSSASLLLHRIDPSFLQFACLNSSCSHLFSTPKSRRLHLIATHSYPSQYFFGVTIWGIEDVLKKGGGMVRRDWQPREGQPGYRSGSSDGQASVSPPPPPLQQLHRSPSPPAPPPPPVDIDDLTLALAGTSISLVPRSVRLARKSKMAT
jgi:hypothetical protein